jgi:peptide/nickel transport system ATP-binding protein
MQTADMQTNSPVDSRDDALLHVKGLSKSYLRGGLWRKRVPIAAARNVSFDIARGQTLALVGESGSGKSTVARCVSRLEIPDAGKILIDGTDIAKVSSHELIPFRARVQMVFQDPITSMNPRFTASQVIEEPLQIQRASGVDANSPQTRGEIVRDAMKQVGLSPDWGNRSILHFSGGQRQRLALARALVLRPELLVLDEALSGLDLSTQSQITNLLLELQASHSLSYLLISHDLALVARLADSIGVMSDGELVELGRTQEIISNPTRTATKKLLESAKASSHNLNAIAEMPA